VKLGGTKMNEIEKNTPIVSSVSTQSLMQDLRQIIEQARGHVAATANYAQTMMYWHIGERINREILGNQRAEYGKQIVSQVATQLQEEFGVKGFDVKNVHRMMQFAQEFPDEQIVATVSRQLSWSQTELPPRDVLMRQIQKSLEAAKARFENYIEEDEE